MSTGAINAADQPLYDLVHGAAPQTIADVVAFMQDIDALLPINDGLKWFNQLYLMVTQQVDLHPPGGAWQSPVWFERLDVILPGSTSARSLDFWAGSLCPRPGVLCLRRVTGPVSTGSNLLSPV